MTLNCLICGATIAPFKILPKRALFTKPLTKAIPTSAADMTLVFCESCRHVSTRLETTMSPEELHAITYGELYRSYAPTGLSGLQKRYTDFVGEWLASQLTVKSKVIEIGSHDGYMLSLLAAKGHDCRGVEPSPFADIAREKYKLEVEKDFFDPSRYEAESFDMVIMRHVVEHVDAPVKFVADAVRVLKPGGLLYIEVPNSQWSVEATYFPEFHADHISYFSMASLLQLFDRAGVRDIRHAEGVSAYMRFPFLNVLARKTEGATVLGASRGGWFMDFRGRDVLERFSSTFDLYVSRLRALKDERPLGVWGTGSIGIQYAIDAGWGLDDNVTYVDPNPASQGLQLSVTGHHVHKPDVLKERGINRLLIASGWEEDVWRQAAPYLAPGAEVYTFADLIRKTSGDGTRA